MIINNLHIVDNLRLSVTFFKLMYYSVSSHLIQVYIKFLSLQRQQEDILQPAPQ